MRGGAIFKSTLTNRGNMSIFNTSNMVVGWGKKKGGGKYNSLRCVEFFFVKISRQILYSMKMIMMLLSRYIINEVNEDLV